MWRTAKRPVGVGCFFVPTATSYRRTSVLPMRTTRIFFLVETAMVSGPLTTSAFTARGDKRRMRHKRTRFMHFFSACGRPKSPLGGEALDGLRLVVVDAEHRQQIGQAESLAHAVLRLEEAQ